jgi:membrane-bound inhibitor of C-type lysozyme
VKTLMHSLPVLLIAAAIAVGCSGATRAASAPDATATYRCDGGKTIEAAYFSAPPAPPVVPGAPPLPDGHVDLRLGDGRALTLPQTISGSGIRYANAAGMVFWSKGRVAFIDENDAPTYSGCIEIAADPGGLPEVYENAERGFSIRYPAGAMVDPAFRYEGLGPGRGIDGVRFSIPASLAKGTNLSADSYLSVETLPDGNGPASLCSADRFLEPGAVTIVTDGGTTYTRVTVQDAGAGNRYEQTVFALTGSNPCRAVRYALHWSVFENYPAGSVKRFDRDALVRQFDAMRRTLILE